MPENTEDAILASLTFSASELDTDDVGEWDQICEAVEEKLREVRDQVLHGALASAKIVVRVTANRKH